MHYKSLIIKPMRYVIVLFATDAIRLAQTHKRYEKDYADPPSSNASHDDWGMYDYE